MKHTKPIVVCIADKGSSMNLLETGYETCGAASFIRQMFDCDVLYYDSTQNLLDDGDWKVFEGLCRARLVVAMVIEPKRYTIDGADVEVLYEHLRRFSSEVPVFIRSVWNLESSIVSHEKDPRYLSNLEVCDALRFVEAARKQFLDNSNITRAEQFNLYKQLQRAENILPCVDIIEFITLSQSKKFIAAFDRTAEIIRGMDSSARAEFRFQMDEAEGIVRLPEGGFRVVRGVSMGPDCSNFAANSWTRDILLTSRGSNHGLAQMKMQLLIEELAFLKGEFGGERFPIESIGGYVYHNVGTFMFPIIRINQTMDSDENSVREVAKFIFDVRLGLPIDHQERLLV